MSQTKIEISNLSDSVVAALAVPKILSLVYPGDDTAAAPTGGQQITLNGSGFVTGALVYVDNTVVGVSSIISGNQIVFTSPAKLAGSYEVKVVNLDGGVAMSNMFMQYSGTPAWSTPSGSLGNVYETGSFSTTLSATSDSAVTYAATSGTLPTGVVITGDAISGTTSIVSGDTTYSFTVDAVDAEQQNTSRNFSIGVLADAVTWNSPADGVSYTSTVGNAFTQTLSATSAAGKTISYSANTLPSGLSIIGSTLSGTFSAATTSASLITATAASTGKTATRTLNWSIASLITAPTSVEYLVVAGGGAGAIDDIAGSGGGGAGGLLSGSRSGISAGTVLTCTIGAGAAGTSKSSNSAAGSNSSIQGTSGTVLALGGGSAYAYSASASGSRSGAGGSGGGAAWSRLAGLGTSGQGNNGGIDTTSLFGGGGGGAGAAGGNNTSTVSGAGGNGSQWPASSGTYYAGGGGGSSSGNATDFPGSGGLGGGGAGTPARAPGIGVLNPGTVNTGGGAGGAWKTGSLTVGAAGGSGIVIIRYADTYSAATSTTGSPTITVAGGYRIYKFTSSGSITF